MKKLLIVTIIMILLAVMAVGCTRNNTPGNTVGPTTTLIPTATADIVPDVTETPGTVSPGVSPDVTETPGAGVTSPEVSATPDVTLPTTSPAAS